MNGFNRPGTRTEQLPADSSGIINMSSPSGSSDSGSSIGGLLDSRPRQMLRPATTANGGRGGGKGMAREMMMRMSNKVQNQSCVINPTTNLGPTQMLMKSPSMGKPAAMNHATAMAMNEAVRQKSTDAFLSQFQVQMSQMKSAMDAVQNEILLHTKSRGAASPTAPVSVVPQVVRRGRGRPPGISSLSGGTGPVRYQSQISTANGLKMKIKKSPRQAKRKGTGVKGRPGRKKKRKDDEDEEDISDDDDRDYIGINQPKSTKTSQTAASSFPVDLESESADLSPSGWGVALPESVLINIFSHAAKYDEGCIPLLVRVSKVCRSWWKVASKPELWTHVDLSTSRVKDKFKIERNLIYFIEHRFHRAKHLNLGGWSGALTTSAIDTLVRYCTGLESLGLSSCQKLTAQNLKTITESCTALKKLDLSAISSAYNTRTAVSLAAIGDAAEVMGPRLTHISLANNCLANCPQMVEYFTEYCPNLETLDLSNVTSPRRDSIPVNIEHLQSGCQRLKILRLTNSEIVLSETTLKEQVTSPGFPQLEELSIAVDPKRCQGMDEEDLARILKNANKLRLLDVRGCSRIGDSGLVRICAWDLEHLYLSGCFATKSSNDGLELVARKWRHSFKEIDFSWTPGEETINSAIKSLAEKDDSEAIPPLKILDLCGSSVSFDSVKVALKTCIYLERLNLTSCRALPRGIKRNYQSAAEITTLREQVLSGKFDVHEDD